MDDKLIAYWETDVELLGRLRLVSSDAGLCKLAFASDSDDVFFFWLERKLQPSGLVYKRTPLITQALAELRAYLSGRLWVFGTPLDLYGTSFQREVWNEVKRIPYGATSTYNEIAARVGRPNAVRAVGAANAANPLPLFVPCHRVVGADDTLRGYGGGLEIKAALLRLEASG